MLGWGSGGGVRCVSEVAVWTTTNSLTSVYDVIPPTQGKSLEQRCRRACDDVELYVLGCRG